MDPVITAEVVDLALFLAGGILALLIAIFIVLAVKS